MNLEVNKRLLLIGCLLLLPSCAQSEYDVVESKIKTQMGWLYKANPDDDFQAAIRNKDYRFIGIYGYSLYVPGVDLKCISVEKDVNPIEGTSDAVLGYEHAKLIAIAGVYAEHYNFRMRTFREKNMGFKCDS